MSLTVFPDNVFITMLQDLTKKKRSKIHLENFTTFFFNIPLNNKMVKFQKQCMLHAYSSISSRQWGVL